MFVFVFRALCMAVILRVSVCVSMASAVAISMQLQIITIRTTPNLRAFLFKANPFASNLQIHLAFCVNNIWDSCSQRNCCCSSQGFVLSIWRWNPPHLIIYCSISEMTAAPSMWRELADGQLWLAGSKFSASNFWKGVIPQIVWSLALLIRRIKWWALLFFPHWKLQTYRGKKKKKHFLLIFTSKVFWSN